MIAALPFPDKGALKRSYPFSKWRIKVDTLNAAMEFLL
jgi:hypothetical protein